MDELFPTKLKSGIHGSDRVLILGASGWFGRTSLSLLGPIVPPVRLMCVSSSVSSIQAAGDTWSGVPWNTGNIREFDPTVVLNFAFLTREKWKGPDDAMYEAENHELIKRLSTAASGPSVRLALTVSSGAALELVEAAEGSDNPYGTLKRHEESVLQDSVRADAAWVIARGWSFSGAEVLRPAAYLFSDLIMQGSRGQITLRSGRPVWRRYVSVSDYLGACLTRGLKGWSGVIDSGGDLVEASELAHEVSTYFGGVTISRPEDFDVTAPPDTYASDNSSWQETLNATGLVADGIRQQIHATARGLHGRGVIAHAGPGS